MSSMHELFDGSGIAQDTPLPDPLFLLHTGALFDGERDDWDIEANSGAAVDALADLNPGATIGLHDEHAVRRLLATEQASRQAAQIENEALKAECLRLQTKADQAAGLSRLLKPVPHTGVERCDTLAAMEELKGLRDLADEYNRLIRHMDAGGDFAEFQVAEARRRFEA